jgi:hypothetical protein
MQSHVEHVPTENLIGTRENRKIFDADWPPWPTFPSGVDGGGEL